MPSNTLALPQLVIQKTHLSLVFLLVLLHSGSTSLLDTGSVSLQEEIYLTDRQTAGEYTGRPEYTEKPGGEYTGRPEYTEKPGGEYTLVTYTYDSTPRNVTVNSNSCQNFLTTEWRQMSASDEDGGVFYRPEDKKIVLCNVSFQTSGVFTVEEIESVDIMSSFLPGQNIGAFLQSLSIPTEAIHSINISDSNISMVNFSSIQLPRLQVLDLRGNNLYLLHQLDLDSLEELYLSNNDWTCVVPTSGIGKWSLSNLEFGMRMQWLLKPEFLNVWRDKDQTKCSKPKTRRWYLKETSVTSFKNKSRNLVLDFIKFTKDTLENCPRGCDCELAQPLAEEAAIYNQFRASVLCSYLNLQELPSRLPEHTVFFDGSNNNISSLYPLQGSTSPYKHLTKINMSNNTITSMEGLRDSWLLRNSPTEIDLTINKLSMFDTTILDHMMNEHSTKMTSVEEGLNFLFADNPWICDCDRIKNIQDFVRRYEVLLKDASEMKCSTSSVYIVDLNYKNECEEDNQSFMTWLVVVEFVLLVAVLSKLTYDVVMYRRTGHLPWVARHLCGKSILCLPGISRFSWKQLFQSQSNQVPESTQQWRGLPSTRRRNLERRGSSGYVTSSATSNETCQDMSGNLLAKDSSGVQFV